MNETINHIALQGDIPAGFIGGLLATVGVFFFLFFAVGVLAVAFTFWMIVDAAKRDKYWWIVLIVLTHIIGAAIYYFKVKKSLIKEQSTQ